jgi:hypothetical protein
VLDFIEEFSKLQNFGFSNEINDLAKMRSLQCSGTEFRALRHCASAEKTG